MFASGFLQGERHLVKEDRESEGGRERVRGARTEGQRAEKEKRRERQNHIQISST